MYNMKYLKREEVLSTIIDLMPELSTPDGSGLNDLEIYAAQEMCVDIYNAICKLSIVELNCKE